MTRNITAIRTRWAAVGAAVAITLGAVGLGGLNIANADISSGDRPVFVPINPCRLIDTRTDAPVGAASTITVTAHGSNGECTGASAIPTDALSLAMNVTATGATASTFLTFWGDGDNPGTSNLNPRPGAAPTPNSVNTPLSTAGNFNIYNDAGEVDVIIDVNGFYAHHDHDDRYPQLPKQILIAPSDFQAEGDELHKWELNGPLFHRLSGSSECVTASFDIPAGHKVTGAELAYEAYDDNDDVRVDIQGFISVPGAHLRPDIVQDIAFFTGPVQATPGSGGGVDDSRLVEGQKLTLEADAAAIDTSRYTYRARVCTLGSLALFSVNVFVAPA